MPQFYPSLSPELQEWALKQSVFFVASAPLRGRHINLSPKGLPDASFAILNPNEAAYIDSTGSGSETISHIRENGRVTVLFCSFDASPRIMRFFCTGSVIEWDEPEFQPFLDRMGGKGLVGARAIIRLHIFKVQTSCGYGVPQLSLAVDSETNETIPYLKDRQTLSTWGAKRVAAGQMRVYQKENNHHSLDGLPGLQSALKDNGESVWLAKMGNWKRSHQDGIEILKSSLLLLFVAMVIMQWTEHF